MSTQHPAPKYRLYPAWCFQASPTYNDWVRMTAADVQLLRKEPEFTIPHTYYYLNHPIRYIYLVGVVVAIDDINLRYTTLTLDDGSGATLEVKIKRLLPEIYNPVDNPSNTEVDNVNVLSGLGRFDVTVDDQIVDIGKTIKVKGMISEFRGFKQLELKRIWIVSATNEEVKFWEALATFKKDVLGRPWHLSKAQGEEIKKSTKNEQKKAREHERQKLVHEAKKKEQRKARAEYLAQREAKYEIRRRKENIMMNAGALI
ncbi:uncharacterized protein N0V89_001218 [Didymosphaeria variabile]|uniref:CST complex subunit STN1 n=1 Tax=Didymosphaeria variabile TaxID=1932322 RepID=A0A9W8XVQ3_9PLEO|nr:uncharacterized protein N0V89_001218 [Didymosphaeria variabile]KAJ4360652.1 hypothetical protein N0V89_001218 [Didymosphaeria variabile]